VRHFGVILDRLQPLEDSLLDLASRVSGMARDDPRPGVAPARWVSRSRQLALLAWGSAPPVGLYSGELIVAERDVALTGTGVYYHPDYDNERELLLALAASRDPDRIIAGMGGSFALCLCDGWRDRVRLWRSVVGQGVGFYREKGSRLVAGNRSLFVSCVTEGSERPRYDPDGVGRFCVTGYSISDLSPFAGVRHMPGHSVLTASRDCGPRISEIDSGFAEFGFAGPAPRSADFDEAAGLLLDGFRALKRDGVDLSIGLSGGKDSRLVAVGIYGAGLDAVTSFSSNWSDHPDLVLGRRVAELLKFELGPVSVLDEESENPTTAPVRIETYLCDQLRGWDARLVSPMGNPFLIEYGFEPGTYDSETPATRVLLSGAGGECLKGGWAQRAFTGNPHYDRETVRRMCERQIGALDYLLAPNRERYRAWFDDWFGANHRDQAPTAALERLYLFLSQNRAMTSASKGGEYAPLSDARLLRFIAKFDVSSRLDELFHFEIIRRIAPQLEDLPIALVRWGFEQDGPDERYRRGYEAREPIPYGRTSAAVHSVRYTTVTDLRDYFDSALARDRPLLAEAYDMDRVEAMVSSRESYRDANAGLLWLMRAAGLLMTDAWLNPLPIAQDPVLVVQLDAPWNLVYGELLDALQSALRLLESEIPASLVQDLDAISRAGRPLLPEDGEFTIARETTVLEIPIAGLAADAADPEIRSAIATARIVLTPPGAKHAGGEMEVKLPNDRGETNWIVLPLAPLGALSGYSVTMRFRACSDVADQSLADIRLLKDRQDASHLLRVQPIRSSPEGEDAEIAFRVAPSGPDRVDETDPEEPVVAWLPVGGGLSRMRFRFEPLVLTRIAYSMRREIDEASGSMLACVTDLGSGFSGRVSEAIAALCAAQQLDRDVIRRRLRDMMVLPVGAEKKVSLADILENSEAWQSYQMLALDRLVKARIGDGSAVSRSDVVAIYAEAVMGVKTALGLA